MAVKRRWGWIGVDVGDRAIKIAQLRQVRDGLELAAATVVPRWATPAGDRRSEFQAAKSLAIGSQGKLAAATISMGLCRVESADNGTAVPEETCVDSWASGPNEAYTLGVPRSAVESVFDGLARVGLQCEVIDGAPLALARALQMAPGHRAGALAGAIDWGVASATFVAATNGQARYVRQLKQCGFGAVVESVAASLELSLSDAELAIQRHGVRGADGDSPAAAVVSEALRQAIRPMVQELKKTLNHMGAKLKSPGPERVYLFGVGATAPRLANTLGEAIGFDTKPWEPAGLGIATDAQSTPACLLGPAIALSALAWESSE